jgi:hypothetical protein
MMNYEIDFKENFKQIKLETELKASIRLIEIGLGELQNLSYYNKFYHLPFQLLASGFERLMKCHICFGYHEKHISYPSFKELKNAGHDLIELKSSILKEYFQINDIPILQEDYNYLSTDVDINQLLDLLSEFGKAARYYNLDIVTENTKPTRNVEEEWKTYETKIIMANPSLLRKSVSFEETDEAQQIVTRHIIILLERFVGGLARQFTIGGLGKRAQQHSYVVFRYISLYNEKLGMTDYRKGITTYKTKERKSHQRNFIDFLNRKFNSDYKHQKILRTEYEGEWPFYVDSVIIECRKSIWCIVSIDGRDYSLNGSAKSRFKLENPYEGGVAIPGISMSDFITMALELGK